MGYSTIEQVYFITGGTCSGKSSIAQKLQQKHGLPCYKLDDYMEPYMQKLAAEGNRTCQEVLLLDMEWMWMRDPNEMCREECQIYTDMFPLAMADIRALAKDGPVLAEGTGFFASLIKDEGVKSDHYICLAPTREFQRREYAKRIWIKYFLEDVSDPEQAFQNWMNRDALLSERMRREAEEHGYDVLPVDGSKSIDENMAAIETAFGLAAN